MSANTIIEMMHSYKISYLVFYAAEKGIFDLLKDPLKVEELSSKLNNIKTNKLRIILNVLVGIGILNVSDEKYQLKSEFSNLLVENSKQSILHLLKLERHLMQNHNTYDALVTALETNEAKDSFNLNKKDGLEYTYGNAMENGGQLASIHIARAFRQINKKNPIILDVGGGKGSYAITINKCVPGASIDIYERPEMEQACIENIRRENLEGKIQFLPIDITIQNISKKYDGILMSNFLHLFNMQTIKAILEKCVQALSDNGILILHDFFLNNNHTEPIAPLLFTLDWLMIGAEFNFSPEDMQNICNSLGLKFIEEKKYSELPTSMIIFQKEVMNS